LFEYDPHQNDMEPNHRIKLKRREEAIWFSRRKLGHSSERTFQGSRIGGMLVLYGNRGTYMAITLTGKRKSPASMVSPRMTHNPCVHHVPS
jgi:hypothetical protein